MKTTKSLLSVLLALTLVFALCTCGGKTAAPEQSTDEAPAAEPESSSNLDEFAGECTFICTRFSALPGADISGIVSVSIDDYAEIVDPLLGLCV